MKNVSLAGRRQQSGVALAIGIILLAIASVVAVMSMRTTTTQERIASNQKNKTISLMAAESGATQIMQRLTNDLEGSVEEILEDFPTSPQSAYMLTDGSGGAWFISNQNYGTPASGTRKILISVTGLSLENPTSNLVLAESVIRIEIDDIATSSGEEEAPLPILLAGGSIRVNGNLEIVGNGHANGFWNITGGKNTITGQLTSSSGSSGLKGSSIPVTSQITVPLVTEVYAQHLSPPGGFTTCNANNFTNGGTYYCSNNVTISKNLTGVTIVSQGNITVNSSVFNATVVSLGTMTIGQSAQLGSETAPVKIGSVGSFGINGGGNINIWGDLLVNGALSRNGGGQSRITGSVRSSGSMTWNGQLQVFGVSGGSGGNPGGDDDTTTYRRTIVEWRELNT